MRATVLFCGLTLRSSNPFVSNEDTALEVAGGVNSAREAKAEEFRTSSVLRIARITHSRRVIPNSPSQYLKTTPPPLALSRLMRYRNISSIP